MLYRDVCARRTVSGEGRRLILGVACSPFGSFVDEVDPGPGNGESLKLQAGAGIRIIHLRGGVLCKGHNQCVKRCEK